MLGGLGGFGLVGCLLCGLSCVVGCSVGVLQGLCVMFLLLHIFNSVG